VLRLGAIAVVASCSFSASPQGGDDAHRDGPHPFDAPPDTRPADAAIDAAPGCEGVGTFQVCLNAMPTTAVTLAAQTIDTGMCKYNGGTAGQVIDPGMGHPHLCAIAGTQVTVAGVVHGVGPNVLVIVSTSDLVIDSGASVDVSSPSPGGMAGAGANPGSCANTINGQDSMMGGGGGAGGSFGGAGNNGGTGSGVGGVAAAATGTPTFMRGGCHGGKGGKGMMGNGGNPGDGGGAVYLVARGTMTITGKIDASGGGGLASDSTMKPNGGGGGGSGGMIALYAATISQTGDIFANGGGGGAANATGQNGGDPTAPAVPGAGGIGDGNGGDGATGLTGALPGGNGSGGGAAGGGVGVVKVVRGGALNANVSPAPS
jgi:hypothetical protein